MQPWYWLYTFILQCVGQLSFACFGWGKGRNVTSAGWQVTLCDPIWHVSSRGGEAGWLTKGEPLSYLLYLVHIVIIGA